MFYTLVSRTIITKINTPRDYLYIFLIGSVAYVIIHWYLHLEKREGISEKVREYLYYAMVIDAIVAYVLMMIYPTKDKDKDNEESNEETNKEENGTYTADQKKAIMQKMQEARRLEQLRQKHMAPVQDQAQAQAQAQVPAQEQKQKQESTKDKESDAPKKSIFSKSDDSKESHETDEEEDEEEEVVEKPKSKSDVRIKTKEKKKESEIEDTEIQVFEANDKPKDKKKAHKE